MTEARLNSTAELLEDIRAGRMVILMDDEDRENEGDLVMAATAVSAAAINFMARFGRGLICLTLTRERCRLLKLPLMVRETDHNQSTNFTVSIEAAEGVTTGISAADRARTIQAAVAPDAVAADIIQPGHIFPLMAQPGGVLTRAGHTEAGCDLAQLAGLEPAAVIVEIMNDDGSMARLPDLLEFAREHDLKIGTIADLIQYRTAHEQTIERISECVLPTEFGEFTVVTFRDTVKHDLHLAMVRGELDAHRPTLVRVHLANPLNDLTYTTRNDLNWPLRRVLQRIDREGHGVAVILNNQLDKDSMVRQLCDYHQQAAPPCAPATGSKRVEDLWTIGFGSQILSDLGVRRLRVLSSPKKIHSISGFGLEVVEYIADDQQALGNR